jgi:ubiquitin carboxyl-terminal hydrolase 22/27/51
VDPTLDIQLDMPLGATDTLTLAQLLRRFCDPERLDHGGKGYSCSACGGGKGVYASKKMSIKKLPPVLAFQLKRFAHGATSSKIETAVRFPSHLNMKPYVEPTAGPASKASSTSGRDGSEAAPTPADDELPSSLYMYDLFAVVTHEGKLDNGHYWADVRSGDEWWHCDDDKVTPTTLSNALKQKAYMLFYVRRSLAYGQPMSRLLAATASSAGANGGANGAAKTVNGKAPNGKACGS